MSITSVNANFSLTIPGIFSSPQKLQGFAADELFDTENQDIGELLMGADGILSAGFVNTPTMQTITLQADSKSISVFAQWWAYEKQNQTKVSANATITMPDLKLIYTLPKGFLKNGPAMAGAGKTLKPVKYTIGWEAFSYAPTGA
jgi:hypothetical protein